jgi:Domain of unknown function (DUF4129)
MIGRTPRRAIRAAILLALLAVRAAAQTAPPQLSIADYVSWIDRVSSELGDENTRLSPAVIRGIPPLWQISTPAARFDVSNGVLIRDLRALANKADPALHARVREELMTLRRAAVDYQNTPADRTGSRAELLRILDDREFRGIHGPTWRDRLRQQILRFVQTLLEGLIGSSAIPTLSDILVYALVAIAVIVLSLWAYRTLTEDARTPSIVPEQMPVSARAWQIWLTDAQNAAARGEWRDAIHLAYWCGVSFLEARGAWKPDRARTPREYLRLLSQSSEHRPALTALTKNFEPVWYGTDQADANRFGEALASLETMGCRPV